MSPNPESGYYVDNVTSGEGHGSLRYGESVNVHLVFGAPVIGEFGTRDTVRPVEKAFKLIRYFPVNREGFIYIARFEPSARDYASDRKAAPVLATPLLNRVFDDYATQWKREVERFRKENEAVFGRALERAMMIPESRTMEWIDYDSEGFPSGYTSEFSNLVVRQITANEIPMPPLVRVEGIDDVLGCIEIASARE